MTLMNRCALLPPGGAAYAVAVSEATNALAITRPRSVRTSFRRMTILPPVPLPAIVKM
jgi:hypothetical protein